MPPESRPLGRQDRRRHPPRQRALRLRAGLQGPASAQVISAAYLQRAPALGYTAMGEERKPLRPASAASRAPIAGNGRPVAEDSGLVSSTDTRRTAKRRIDSLSADRLRVADDFLAYLQERESNEATEELLSVPGFIERLEKAERQIAAGKVTPAEKLRRKCR